MSDDSDFIGSALEERRNLGERAPVAAPTEEELTQADIDAIQADLEVGLTAGLEVRDIPGLRVLAHSDDKEAWRAARENHGGISATAMTTVMGTNPFQNVMDLWRERMEGKRATFSRFSLTVMTYGTEAEPELLEQANSHVHPQPHFVLTHGYVVGEDERFGCTPDAWRFALGEGETREGGGTVLELAEFKTGSKPWRKTPRSKPVVPPNYADQCYWQMLVTGAARVLVVYRQVERDKAGNVTAVIRHEHVWLERDEKRIAAMVEAANAWLKDEADLIPPMTYIDLEDQFDDAADITARKSAVRDALEAIAAADSVLARTEYQNAISIRDESLAALKGLMRLEKGRQVIAQYGGMGATLSRGERVKYETDRLTAAQRERIRVASPTDTLRTSRLNGE